MPSIMGRKEYYEVRICGICGSIEAVELLVTCCQCKKVSEHTYCMNKLGFEVSAVWHCEGCPPVPGVFHQEKVKNKFKSQNTAEAICSSFEKTLSPSMNNYPLQSSGCTVDDSKKKTEVITHAQDGSQEKLEAKETSPNINPPSADDGMKPSSCNRSKAFERRKKIKLIPVEEVASMTSGKRISSSHQSLGPSSFWGDQENIVTSTVSRKISPLIHMPADQPNKGYVGVDSQLCSPKNTAMVECVRNDEDNKNPKIKSSGTTICSHSGSKEAGCQENGLDLKLVMFSDERILYAPVYCWKGMFEVFDVLSHVHNGIQAHFPRIVCHRAYDVFKKIPEKLKLKEVPRKDVWPHIFQVDPPDKDDIGLYFFPDKLERRKDKYIRLLERIDLHDSAMRSSINEAELLVFSSKMLPVDSQRIDGQAYLWGVLRGVKNRKPGQHIKKHFPPCNPPPAAVGSKNCSISSAPFIGNVEEVDMEIDMIGGKEVGIMDKPIPRVDIPPGFTKQVGMTDKPTPRVDIPPALTKQVSMTDKPIPRVDIPPGFTKPYSRVVNPENRLLSPFPPGFSKIPKFKCQSISLKANDKGSIVSKMDSSGLVSSTTRGGDVATPKEPVMQPDYHQVSDHQEKVAGHLKSSIASPTSEFNFGKSEGQGCDVIVPNVPKESEDKEIMEIHSIPLSLVSASYNSPSCSPERQLPSAVQSKEGGVHESKIAVLDKCVFENEIEEEKAAGKSISDIKIKQIALVSASYDSSQSSPEPKLSSKGTPMLTLFPEEADPEFKRGTVQMDLELDISRSAPSISPDLSLSRPQYVNDGHVWISNNSRDRLKRDDCGKELQLSLLSCQRRL